MIISVNYLSAPFLFCLSFLGCALYQETFCVEKFKSQEETYYLDNITIAPRKIVFIIIVRRYTMLTRIKLSLSIPLKL